MMGRSFFLFVTVLLRVFHLSLCEHGEELESLGFVRCIKHELDALLKFKLSFTEDPKNRLSSWVGKECCQWHGVICDNVTHNVVKLNLRSLPPNNVIYLPDPRVSMVSSEVSSSLLELKLLTYLDLSGNDFSGSHIPEFIGQLTNLNYLDLSYIGFKGQIPASFVKLSALKYLDLSENKLSGMIPDFIRNLAVIEHLDISSNSIHGTVTGIGNLSKLLYLDMNFNNLNLNLDSSFNWRPPFQLNVFNVHSCVIKSMFPQWIRNQTQLYFLDLSYTGISGELPAWLWNSSSFVDLRLSGNRLTGTLPQELDYYKQKFWRLDLHNNLLSGTIPKWLGFCQIQVIDLSSNLLTGAIFDGNNASFFLPTQFKYPSDNPLMVLDLSDNMLSGEIQFGELENFPLLILSLRGNYFNGPIPSQLCDLRWLSILELAQNRFTGHIPRCLGSIGFDYSGEPIGDTTLQINKIVKGIIVDVLARTKGSAIDLSSNYLVGTIPEELTNMSTLFALNLSFNSLTGPIPENIGNMKTVESLDLSNNHLSGTIPQSLSSISWLSKLNLSNNNLHGPIPTGTQLQTLVDPSIYAGNSGLCGFPLPNSCTELHSAPSFTNGDEKDNKYKKMWFILAVMYGVATGFWGVVGTLVIKRTWRHAYFRYVEDLADRIYVPMKVRVNTFKRRFNKNS